MPLHLLCSFLSLHLHMTQKMTTLPWVKSPPQVTPLNIQAVPLHNLPCQHTGKMTWRKKKKERDECFRFKELGRNILNKLLFRQKYAEGSLTSLRWRRQRRWLCDASESLHACAGIKQSR